MSDLGQAPADGIDPHAPIPPAIRAQVEQIEALYRPQEPQEPQQTPNNGENAPNPAPEAAGTQQQVDIPAFLPPSQAPTQAQQAQEPAQAPPQAAPIPAEADNRTWEHRYNSMKGRHDQLRERVRQLEGLLADFHTRQSQQQPQQTPLNGGAPPELRAERLVTAEEEETYGKEFLQVVEKKAREISMPIINQLQQQIAKLEGRVEGTATTVTRDAKQRMYDMLDREFPEWEKMNLHQPFVDWLKERDVLSGEVRYNLLQQALAASDAQRVLAFLRGFQTEEAALAPAPAPVIQPAAPPAPRVNLATLAAPGRARTAQGSSPPAEKPIYTQAQIAAFYADKNSGKHRGQEANADAMERDMFLAQREGRVR